MTVIFKSPQAVPHKYRNRFLRDSGTTVIGGGSSSGGSSIDLSSYLKKSVADSLYLGIEANAVSASKFAAAQAIVLTGDVIGTATSDGSTPWSILTIISDGTVTNAKLANDSVTMWGETCALGGSVSGAMTGVTTVNTSIHFETDGMLGINTEPSYPLDVNGQTYLRSNVGILVKPNSDYALLVNGVTQSTVEVRAGKATVYSAMNAMNFYSTKDGGTTRDFDLGGCFLRLNSNAEDYRVITFKNLVQLSHGNDDDYTLELKNADGSTNIPALKIGDAYITYDSDNDCVKIYNKDGKAINLLVTGGVTCLA